MKISPKTIDNICATIQNYCEGETIPYELLIAKFKKLAKTEFKDIMKLRESELFDIWDALGFDDLELLNYKEAQQIYELFGDAWEMKSIRTIPRKKKNVTVK